LRETCRSSAQRAGFRFSRSFHSVPFRSVPARSPLLYCASGDYFYPLLHNPTAPTGASAAAAAAAAATAAAGGSPQLLNNATLNCMKVT